MNFDYTPKVRELQARLDAFMDGSRVSERAPLTATRSRATARRAIPGFRRGSSRSSRRGARRRAVEPLPAAIGARRGTHQSRIRAAGRDHGPRHLGAGGLQLQRAGHRQHGDDRALRHAGAEAAVARAAARGRDPVGVPDDGAGRRLVGRDQHRVQHGAGRRSVRRQRPQVVVVGRGRSALPDLHRDGQDRSRRAEASPAVDAAGARGRARGEGRPAAHRPQRGRRAARAHGNRSRRRARAGDPPAEGRGLRLRDRAGAARARTHPPLHASHRPRRARARADVPPAFRARCVRQPRSRARRCGRSASPSRAA